MPTRAQAICPRCRRKHQAGKRCPTCNTRRGTPTQRGYDADHRALRAAIQQDMDQGVIYHCWRCRGEILQHQPWDLGHNELTGQHRGPEHIDCNRGTPFKHRAQQ